MIVEQLTQDQKVSQRAPRLFSASPFLDLEEDLPPFEEDDPWGLSNVSGGVAMQCTDTPGQSASLSLQLACRAVAADNVYI